MYLGKTPIFLQRDKKGRSHSVPKMTQKGVSVRAASQRLLPTEP